MLSFQYYDTNSIVILKKVCNESLLLYRHDHKRIGFQNPVE